MPEQRMSAQLTRLAKKRGRLPALVAALALAVLLALQQFFGAVVSVVFGSFEFQPTPDQLLVFILPVSLGVFLSLWVVAPISHELTVRFVLTRAGLASAAGALVLILFQTVYGLLQAFVPGSRIVDFELFGHNTLVAVVAGASTFIFYTPVVMLAGVLLWLWLRDHPRDYEVAGLIDEV